MNRLDELREEARQRQRLEEIRSSARTRGGQQPAVTGSEAMDALNRFGRAGMGGMANVIPGFRQGAQAYERATGRQVLPTQPPQGLLESGGEMLGSTLPLSLATGGLLAQRGASLTADPVGRGVQATIDRLGRDTSRFWSQSPVTAGTAEVGAGIGAGIGAEALSGAQIPGIPIPGMDMGTPEFALPGAETIGATGGGMFGGSVASAIPATAARGGAIASRFAEDLLPTTEWSAMNRAARQLQRDTADPEGAARLALEARDPITGAQATGESGLMARQAAIEREFPGTRADVQTRRQRAVDELTESFSMLQGQPIERGDWQRRMIQAAAPEGSTISRGDPDKMMAEAYAAFDPGYRFIDNLPMPMVGLSERVEAAVTAPGIYGGEEAVARAMPWLSSRLANLDGDVVTAGDIRRIRTEIRDTRRRVDNRADKDVLDAAEDALTQHLNENIVDPEIVQRLQNLDHQYRKHVVLTDAFARTDRGATPETMIGAIQTSLSPGQFARGEAAGLDDLRALARLGQSSRTVMGKPDEARLMIRDLPDPDKQTFRAGFVNELMADARRTGEGADFIDGSQLLAAIRREGPTLDAMGFTATDKARMTDIANRLMTVQRNPEAVAAQIYEDGPSNVVQLVTALIGAKGGQRLAGQGLGSSLVLASFGSRLMRNAVSTVFSDASIDVLVKASQPTREGRELYAALLTRPTDSIRKQDEAARVIMSTMFGAGMTGAQELIENFPGE